MTNAERVESARKALEELDDGSVAELLANVLHYCAANTLEFADELRSGRRLFDEQVLEEGYKKALSRPSDLLPRVCICTIARAMDKKEERGLPLFPEGEQ
jgi:hypothetical protein